MKRLFLLIWMLPLLAWAEPECKPVNLVTEENSPFQKIPVFDQDGLNICYAYSAAQLADFHLMKKGNPERVVHPLWTAMKFAESEERNTLGMGISYYALKALKKAGNCRLESLNGALSEWARKAQASEIEVVGLLELLTEALPGVPSDQLDQTIAQVIKNHAPYCRGNPTWDQLMPELRSLSALSSRELLSKQLLPVCQQEITKLSIPSPSHHNPRKDDQVLSMMDSKLDLIKAPLSISYCSNMLYDDNYRGVKRESGTTVVDDCNGHDSLVVGKKKIGGKCHFLLRNTWGSGFHRSNTQRTCLCKNRRTGAYLDDCSEGLHNNGENIVEGCWVDGDLFAKNTFGITYLED